MQPTINVFMVKNYPRGYSITFVHNPFPPTEKKKKGGIEPGVLSARGKVPLNPLFFSFGQHHQADYPICLGVITATTRVSSLREV